MSHQDLLYETKGHTAWITINRPAARNALTTEVMDLFQEYLTRAEADDQVRVICITGAGDKAFCAGADLAAAADSPDPLAAARKYAGLLKRLAVFPKPLAARVNGHCVAGGLGLMLSCDVVYARDGSKFGTPEVNVGLFPMMIGALIFRNALRKKAQEMIYTARMYSAVEAEEMGLITRVYPPEEFDRAVNEVLETIADKGPLALKIGRQALAAVGEMDLANALDYLCRKLGEVAATEDATEGLLAFLEKRKPEWKNR
ncbi:MAG: enoyl-CoA hydratase-related protein [Pseudomonadota bacterium]